MTREAKNPVKATRRSFDVLEALATMGSARLTELADRLDRTPSTVHNHLSTLVESGFVTRDGDRYRISLQFLTYGAFARERYRITAASRIEVRDLATETNEPASVVVAEDGHGYVLAHEHGHRALPLELSPGTRLPLYASSFGKVLLADQPDEEIDAFIDRHELTAYTTNTITDPTALLEELEAVRSRGYAIETEERRRGIRSIATAVRNDQGSAVGAIGVTGPTSRLTDEHLRGSVLEAVLNTKNVVELQLTHA